MLHESEAQQEKEHSHSQYENLEIILQFEYLEPFPIYSQALINSQNAIRAQRGTGAKNWNVKQLKQKPVFLILTWPDVKSLKSMTWLQTTYTSTLGRPDFDLFEAQYFLAL